MFNPALHKAVKKRNFETVRTLLNDETIDIDGKDLHQCTPLHVAVLLENEEIVKILLEKKANFCLKNELNETPLQYALNERNFDMVKILIDAGDDGNSKDFGGSTALHLATIQNDAEFVKFLLSRKVDVDAKDCKGNTALVHALGLQNNLEMVKILVGAGADIKVLNHLGKTPIHLAAENNDISLVNFLLSRVTSIDAKDSSDQTALLNVVKNSAANSNVDACTLTAEVLLKNFADINLQDS